MATKTARLLKQHETSNTNSLMAKLLAKKETQVQSFKKGDIVKGTVTKLTKQEILVDLNGKADALVLERDKRILHTLLTTLKVGDEVSVSVLSPESDNGHPVVSLRRFVDDKVWDKLGKIQSDRKLVNVEITDITKGGYVVQMESGASGFLPQSHVMHSQNQDVAQGSTIQVYVQDLKRQDGKIIFSQKQSLTPEEFKAVMAQYKKDQKVTASVENITPFGLFVSLPYTKKGEKEEFTVDGLIHISEVSWEKVDNITDQHSVGDSVEAVIIGFDTDSKRVDLSFKRMSEDPFVQTLKKYPVDAKVEATVLKTVDGNVHVQLEEGVEGVIRKEKVPANKTYNTGDSVNLVVSNIDERRRKIELTPVLLEKPLMYR